MKTQYSYCYFKEQTDEADIRMFPGLPCDDLESCLEEAKAFLARNKDVRNLRIVKDVALVTPDRPVLDEKFKVVVYE